VLLDTSFYKPEIDTFIGVFRSPVITPLNNFVYNYSPENLAKHGLHPFYQHIVANLPQLLGPAFLLIPFCHYKTIRIHSSVCGIVVLSLFPHQEARFLIPAVPLILSSIRFPTKFPRVWIASWVAFNLVMGVLMGTYHQGGVVPMQIHIANQGDIKHAFWWKTYSPPIWLLDGRNAFTSTTDFMGMPSTSMLKELEAAVSCKEKDQGVVLIAPASATFLDRFSAHNVNQEIVLEERWRYKQHLNLDDIDFAKDGVGSTISRVLGRRGLVLWDVTRRC
jgi:phosphatidylinositol glycan class Z